MQIAKHFDKDDDLAKSIVQLTNNLEQEMKRLNKSSSDGVPQHVPETSLNIRNYNPSRKKKIVEPSLDSRNMRSEI